MRAASDWPHDRARVVVAYSGVQTVELQLELAAAVLMYVMGYHLVSCVSALLAPR